MNRPYAFNYPEQHYNWNCRHCGGTTSHIDHFAGLRLVYISVDTPLILYCDHFDHGSKLRKAWIGWLGYMSTNGIHVGGQKFYDVVMHRVYTCYCFTLWIFIKEILFKIGSWIICRRDFMAHNCIRKLKRKTKESETGRKNTSSTIQFNCVFVSFCILFVYSNCHNLFFIHLFSLSWAALNSKHLKIKCFLRDESSSKYILMSIKLNKTTETYHVYFLHHLATTPVAQRLEYQACNR